MVAKIRNLSLVLTKQMKERKPIRIKFIGDVSFNHRYVALLESGQNPFEAVEPLLQDADLVVGNLECLAQGTAQNKHKIPRIYTSARALRALQHLNLKLVSLATNHVYDNLRDGFTNTLAQLDAMNVAHLGAALHQEEAAQPFIFEKDGCRIGFLNYVHQDTNPKLPAQASVHPNMYHLPTILAAIGALKTSVDKVVLLLHWGGKCDYGYFPHRQQIDHAKQMVDAGAHAIIGHHSHTFQTHMVYKGAPIYFSLGNFCFDDIVMDQHVFPVRESGRKGGVLALAFYPTRTTHQVLPFRQHNLRLQPDATLHAEFKRWQRLFTLVRNLPGAYAFYYYFLKRWEPVHFHAQQHNIPVWRVAFQKVKRIFGRA